MLSKLLSPEQDELLKEERRVLARLRTALARFDAAPDQQAALERSIEQLDELFLLVIVGEFNAGKSAFINALVGSKVAEEGVTPTTAQINILQYGETPGRAEPRAISPGRDRARSPSCATCTSSTRRARTRSSASTSGSPPSSCRAPTWCCS